MGPLLEDLMDLLKAEILKTKRTQSVAFTFQVTAFFLCSITLYFTWFAIFPTLAILFSLCFSEPGKLFALMDALLAQCRFYEVLAEKKAKSVDRFI
jgi:hypothetical protein